MNPARHWPDCVVTDRCATSDSWPTELWVQDAPQSSRRACQNFLFAFSITLTDVCAGTLTLTNKRTQCSQRLNFITFFSLVQRQTDHVSLLWQSVTGPWSFISSFSSYWHHTQRFCCCSHDRHSLTRRHFPKIFNETPHKTKPNILVGLVAVDLTPMQTDHEERKWRMLQVARRNRVTKFRKPQF